MRQIPGRAGAFPAAVLLAWALAALPSGAAGEEDVIARINLPPGFVISIYAHVPGARSLTYVPETNEVFVGSRGRAIHSVRDVDGDGTADEVLLRADGLNVPNGIAYRDGRLYAALQDRVVAWRLPDAPARPLGAPATIRTGLPDKRHHGWRYAGFGPDGRLYVTLGAACNICALDGIEGTVVRMDGDGSNFEIVATGVRNSVGLDWHPTTGALFFTDNGADNMGDDIPPDELNRLDRPGQHFGFPFLGGRDIRLTGFESAAPPADATAPVLEFQAHTASLGIRFYRGAMFPADYRNDAFVAQHGSWNRSEPVGYRIVRVRFDALGNVAGSEAFADGWLQRDGSVLGRPVDILELPDGSLLVSDDHRGAIYRISFRR